jgi:hypothetical protein
VIGGVPKCCDSNFVGDRPSVSTCTVPHFQDDTDGMIQVLIL